METIVGLFGHQFADDSAQPFGDVGIDLSNGRWLIVSDAAEYAVACLCAKWRTPGAHCVQHATKAEQITAMINRFGSRLLRRHVQWCSCQHSGSREGCIIHGASESKVRQYRTCNGAVEQDVGRFDIAMDQPLSVRGGKSVSSVHANPQYLAQLQRTLVMYSFLQGDAVHVLHDQIGSSLPLVDCVDRQNIVVDHGRSRLAFATKASPCGARSCQVRQ